MEMKVSQDRRGFLKAACMAAGTFALAKPGVVRAAFNPVDEDEKKVSVSEDLMREHGVLRRVLIVYKEISGRIVNGKSFPVDALRNSADIIRSFVEDYHEKLEENYLFPRFEKEGKMTDLVKNLKQQHDAGRRLTDMIKKNADTKNDKNLVSRMNEFINMYSPHAAREDTILFPEFRKIVSDKEYDSFGEEFEKKEKQMFGEDGFEKMVGKVEDIEKTLGIYDLSKFTPKV